MTPWQIAALCGLGFLVTHHGMSHLPVRDRLVGALGRWGYLGLYSAVATALYAPVAVLWWRHTRTTPVWWALWGFVPRTLTTTLCIAGFWLLVGGVLESGRTSLSTSLRGKQVEVPVGASAFTRHPVFWGVVLWSLGHLVVDGGAVDVAFHGTNIAVGVLGGLHQDARYLARDPGYAAWMARTRFAPLPWPVPDARFTPLSYVALLAGLALAAGARIALHT